MVNERRQVFRFAVALRIVVLSLFALFASASTIFIVRVYSDSGNRVHVVTRANRNTQKKVFTLQPEQGQVGIDSIKIANDRMTAGWLVLYKDPDGGSPDAGKLVVWRNGHILHRFPADQVFWSWSFENGGEQVAYHVGPTHGNAPHCELRDVQSGRLLESWDGDWGNPNRPVWTKRLDH